MQDERVRSGMSIHLGRTGDTLCPVFLGARLSRQVLVTAVRSALLAAGVDVRLYNGHSFCIGAAITAALAGLPDSVINSMGQWK